MLSLRKVVLNTCGQDVYRCRNCSFCGDIKTQDMDLTFESLVMLIQVNDVEVLSSRTLWSDQVMKVAVSACNGGINLPKVLQALRIEAVKRGIEGCNN